MGTAPNVEPGEFERPNRTNLLMSHQIGVRCTGCRYTLGFNPVSFSSRGSRRQKDAVGYVFCDSQSKIKSEP